MDEQKSKRLIFFRPEFKILLFLFIIPTLAELLTGSAPPVEYFNPFSLAMFIILYGGGAVLIREAKIRWWMQWSVIFLAVAYGILEEGTIVQSFFNTSHIDLREMKGYGMYGGIQWTWAINVTVFHATLSTLVPISMSELLWPEYRRKALLKGRGIAIIITLILLLTVFLMLLISSNNKIENFRGYRPNYLLVLGSFVVVVVLIWFGYIFRKSDIISKSRVSSPITFGIAGFLFYPLLGTLVRILIGAGVHGSVAILVQCVLVVLILIFVFSQIYNIYTTQRHIVSLITGSCLFWIVLTPLHEMGHIVNASSTKGMLVVGIVCFTFLMIWRKAVLKKIL